MSTTRKYRAIAKNADRTKRRAFVPPLFIAGYGESWPIGAMRTVVAGLCMAVICTACSRGQQITDSTKKYDWSTQLTRRSGEVVAKGMLIDTAAISADPAKPAFLAPPPGSKVYHGFPIVEGIAIDGFRLGTVTDFNQSDSPAGCTIGDAFVEAPDGTRAGLMWEVGDDRFFSMVQKPEADRWGVYYFIVPYPVKSKADLQKNFEEILPQLKELHLKAKDRDIKRPTIVSMIRRVPRGS